MILIWVFVQVKPKPKYYFKLKSEKGIKKYKIKLVKTLSIFKLFFIPKN